MLLLPVVLVGSQAVRPRVRWCNDPSSAVKRWQFDQPRVLTGTCLRIGLRDSFECIPLGEPPSGRCAPNGS